MNSASRKFVHDLIAEGLNLPKSKVIWYMPNAPRPQKPYATLECFAEVGESQEDIVKTNVTGVYNFVVPVTSTLRVQLYGNKGDDVCEMLNVLAIFNNNACVSANIGICPIVFHKIKSV